MLSRALSLSDGDASDRLSHGGGGARGRKSRGRQVARPDFRRHLQRLPQVRRAACCAACRPLAAGLPAPALHHQQRHGFGAVRPTSSPTARRIRASRAKESQTGQGRRERRQQGSGARTGGSARRQAAAAPAAARRNPRCSMRPERQRRCSGDRQGQEGQGQEGHAGGACAHRARRPNRRRKPPRTTTGTKPAAEPKTEVCQGRTAPGRKQPVSPATRPDPVPAVTPAPSTTAAAPAASTPVPAATRRPAGASSAAGAGPRCAVCVRRRAAQAFEPRPLDSKTLVPQAAGGRSSPGRCRRCLQQGRHRSRISE